MNHEMQGNEESSPREERSKKTGGKIVCSTFIGARTLKGDLSSTGSMPTIDGFTSAPAKVVNPRGYSENVDSDYSSEQENAQSLSTNEKFGTCPIEFTSERKTYLQQAYGSYLGIESNDSLTTIQYKINKHVDHNLNEFLEGKEIDVLKNPVRIGVINAKSTTD
jgi:hypothetical protein